MGNSTSSPKTSADDFELGASGTNHEAIAAAADTARLSLELDENALTQYIKVQSSQKTLEKFISPSLRVLQPLQLEATPFINPLHGNATELTTQLNEAMLKQEISINEAISYGHIMRYIDTASLKAYERQLRGQAIPLSEQGLPIQERTPASLIEIAAIALLKKTVEGNNLPTTLAALSPEEKDRQQQRLNKSPSKAYQESIAAIKHIPSLKATIAIIVLSIGPKKKVNFHILELLKKQREYDVSVIKTFFETAAKAPFEGRWYEHPQLAEQFTRQPHLHTPNLALGMTLPNALTASRRLDFTSTLGDQIGQVVTSQTSLIQAELTRKTDNYINFSAGIFNHPPKPATSSPQLAIADGANADQEASLPAAGAYIGGNPEDDNDEFALYPAPA